MPVKWKFLYYLWNGFTAKYMSFIYCFLFVRVIDFLFRDVILWKNNILICTCGHVVSLLLCLPWLRAVLFSLLFADFMANKLSMAVIFKLQGAVEQRDKLSLYRAINISFLCLLPWRSNHNAINPTDHHMIIF